MFIFSRLRTVIKSNGLLDRNRFGSGKKIYSCCWCQLTKMCRRPINRRYGNRTSNFERIWKFESFDLIFVSIIMIFLKKCNYLHHFLAFLPYFPKYKTKTTIFTQLTNNNIGDIMFHQFRYHFLSKLSILINVFLIIIVIRTSDFTNNFIINNMNYWRF